MGNRSAWKPLLLFLGSMNFPEANTVLRGGGLFSLASNTLLAKKALVLPSASRGFLISVFLMRLHAL